MTETESEEFGGTERFRIIRPLGKGGMGAVYEAHDRRYDERIALKTLRHTTAHYLYYLKKEFRILQGLHHPNLIRLGELIEEGGRWFFTMELIRGADFLTYVRGGVVRARGKVRHAEAEAETLAARSLSISAAAGGTLLRTRTISSEEIPEVTGPALDLRDLSPAVGNATLQPRDPGPDAPLRKVPVDHDRLREAMLGAVSGLSVLHAAGLIHRDVKPANLMVNDEARVVLLDFGLAHVQAQRKGILGSPTQLMGTPGYMSPEQYGAGHLTAASDLFSLGASLYEALTGQLPFVGTAVEVVDAIRRGEVRAPSSLVEGVPEEIDELCLRLLDYEPENRPSAHEIRHTLGDSGEAPARTSSFPLSTDHKGAGGAFVGRSKELSELRAAFAETRSGRPVSVFVEGTSGIGKSALVRRFLDSLEGVSPVVLLVGRCYERESVPYKAFDSLIDDLSWYLKSLPQREMLELMPARSDALVRLFPVLDPGDGSGPPVDAARANPQDLRGHAFSALKELLAAIARRSELVLFIDDLQWGDIDSAALLRELIRQPDAPAMLFVATYRSDHADEPMIKDLVADRRRIVLSPMSGDEARALIERMAGEQDADLSERMDEIAREGRGSPFFLGEMVRHLCGRSRGALPTERDSGALLERVISERVAQLPQDAATLLRAAVVIGRPVEKGLVVQVAGLDKAQGRRALEVLHSAKMLRTHMEGQVEIYHDRLRESVVAGLAPEAVREVYNRVAAVLEESHWERSDLLGLDFIASKDPERALRYARAAAEQAESGFAFDRAARLYELAIELASAEQYPELALRYANVLRYGGYSADAARVYLELAENAAAENGVAADDQAVELTRLAADALLRAGHIEQGLARFEQVASRLGVKTGRTRMRTVLAVAGNRFRISLRGLGYKPRPEADCPPQDLARLDSLFSVATTLGMVDHLKGAVLQTEHLRSALRLGEERRVCRALAAEVAFLAALGGRQARRAERLSREVLLHAEDLGDPYLIAGAHLGTAYLRFFNGQYIGAHESFSVATEQLASCPDARWEQSAARYWDHLALVSLGEFNLLAKSVPLCIREAEERNDRHTRSVFKGHPTVWYKLRDDLADDADRELDGALEGWPQDSIYQAHYIVAIGRVMVRLYEGDYARAIEMLDDTRPVAKALLVHRMPFALGEVHKLRGLAAVAMDDRRSANKAVRGLENFGIPVARAYAAMLQAALALRDGDPRRARGLLLEAIEGFEQAGAKHDAAGCRYRAGQIVGGSQGDKLIAAALEWMDDQGVRSPSKMIEFLAPGFPPAQ